MSDCIEWPGARSHGYGVTTNHRGGIVRVHRQVMAELHGSDAIEGKVVMHTCDNKACINVEHLRIGTQADNMADMDAKGRRARSGRRGDKLTYRKAIAIRHMRRCGMEQRKIAEFFNVSEGSVSMVINGRTWSS